jgi:hypothetical protein
VTPEADPLAGTRAAGPKPEFVLLQQLWRSALAQPGAARPDLSGINWAEFLRIAQENRILLMVAKPLGALGQPVPDEVWQTIERYRTVTMRLNGAGLVTLRGLATLFADAGIDVLAIKGPTALMALHGDAFIRPSTDIDLLVRRKHFDRAGQALEAHGFSTPKGASTVWWREFLGEQHYFSDDGRVVDLHHRVQQPGCPAPRSPNVFFDTRVHVPIGGNRMPILSPTYACLLSCMSLLKAVSNGEPCGSHACDIAQYVTKASAVELSELVAASRATSLFGTLRFGLRVVSVLFGLRIADVPASRALPFIDDATLAAVVFDPEAARPVRAKRTRLLINVSDSPIALGLELCRKFASEAARLATPQ